MKRNDRAKQQSHSPSRMDFTTLDRSYQTVLRQLELWHEQSTHELEQIHQKILTDLDKSFELVEKFLQLSRIVLVEQERQLSQVTTEREIDTIEQRIDVILGEIQNLEHLAFQLNIYSKKFQKNFRILYKGEDLSSIFLPQNKAQHWSYRLLISPSDAAQIKAKASSSNFILDASSYECVLTFNVEALDDFLSLFDLFCQWTKNFRQFRLLIPDQYISFIKGDGGERLRSLQDTFQLSLLTVSPQLCPKSDERILNIRGKNKDELRTCIDEIYDNLNHQRTEKPVPRTMRYYSPSSLTEEELRKTRADDDELSLLSDEELWNEIEDWSNHSSKPEQSSETTERTRTISNHQAGVIIGMNATRIDRIKQISGAYVYITGESKDAKRIVIMRGTHRQVDLADKYIEKVIEKHRQGKLTLKHPRSTGKTKEKISREDPPFGKDFK